MATLTITLDVDQAQRVSDAFTVKLGLLAPAGIPDVKAWVIQQLINEVHSYETGLAAVAAADAVATMGTPT